MKPMLQCQYRQGAAESKYRIVFPVVQVQIKGERTRKAKAQAGEKARHPGAVLAELLWKETLQVSFFAQNHGWVNYNEREQQQYCCQVTPTHDCKSRGEQRTAKVERVPRQRVNTRSCNEGVFFDHTRREGAKDTAKRRHRTTDQDGSTRRFRNIQNTDGKDEAQGDTKSLQHHLNVGPTVQIISVHRLRRPPDYWT